MVEKNTYYDFKVPGHFSGHFMAIHFGVTFFQFIQFGTEY